MTIKMERFPAKNPNPVLSVEKNGTVLYSNEAGEPLLNEWGVKVGDKLPSYIEDLIQTVISRNNPEKLEVKAGNRVYLISLHHLPEEECVNIYGFDISDHKEFEKEIQKSEACEVENIELEDIFDIPAIQSLIDDLYRLTHITIGLVDIKGNISVIAGQQEICSRFHRVHPETCKQCIESDTKLSLGVAPTELKMYKCKNNMWDVATPLIVEGQPIGNIISGQFFFDDEPIDYELFRSQARKYGFNEEEYIAALEKVPRLSREAVNKNMSFFMKLANMLSQLSHSNFKLAKSLSERETLLEALRKSESKYLQIMETAQEGVWIIDRNDRTVFVNQRFSEMLGYSIDEIMGQKPQKFLSPEFLTVANDRLLEHRQRVRQAIDYRFIRKDGSDLWCINSTHQLFDDEGNYAGSLGMLTDITERKRAEEEIKSANNMLQLIMNNIPQGIFWKDRNSLYMGCNKVFAKAAGMESPENIIGKTDYDLPWSPEQTEWFLEYDRRIMKNETPEYHIVEPQRQADGELAWVETNKIPLHDTKGNVIGILGTYEDITERKKAEVALKEARDNLEEKVKERTAELEIAYNSLKESEERLAEAQKIAHVGSWERNLATNKLYWSDEVYRIFGLDPQEFELTFNSFYDCVHPEDRDYLIQTIKEALTGKPYNIDYRIILPDGEKRIVHVQGGAIFNEKNIPVRFRGVVQDITDRKKAEEALAKIEVVRKQEIHHRIKNNLQVISSLLDLQAEQFQNRTCINDCSMSCIRNPEVIEAFRESQNRVISMALIHEELYKGGEIDTLNFSSYIEELANSLLQTYRVGNSDISLKMVFAEDVFFNMDTAVPLGIVVNEIVSNSLKHAFIGRDKGEIQIKLHREENGECKLEDCKSTAYVLSISDNGVGIPENLDIEELDSLGLQLVTTLVDQLDGELELKRNNGTKFVIRFTVTEKDNQASEAASQSIDDE